MGEKTGRSDKQNRSCENLEAAAYLLTLVPW